MEVGQIDVRQIIRLALPCALLVYNRPGLSDCYFKTQPNIGHVYVRCIELVLTSNVAEHPRV